MDIEVRLFATLRRGRFNRQIVDLLPESKVEDVFQRLALGRDEVAILLVNGLEARPDQELHAGDTVSLFPGLGGG